MRIARWIRVLSFFYLVAATLLPVFLPASIAERWPHAPFVGWAPLALAFGFLLPVLRIGWRSKVRGTDEGIVVVRRGRTRVIRRADVASAVALPRPWDAPGSAIEIELARGDVVVVEAEDPSAADRILADARLGAAARRVSMRLSPRFAWFAALLFGFVCFFFIAMATAVRQALLLQSPQGSPVTSAVLLLMLPAMAFAYRALAPPIVSVGADGVSARGLFVRRFLPIERIVSATAAAPRGSGPPRAAVHVMLTDGSVVSFSGMFADHAHVAAIAKRINDVVAARRAGAPPEDAGRAKAALLERAGRPVREWRAALERLARPADAYRVAAVTAEELETVVVSPTATVDQRVGAALALRASGEASACAHIRVAAEASAEPRVRVALERIAAAEEIDAAVEAALEEALARRHD